MPAGAAAHLPPGDRPAATCARLHDPFDRPIAAAAPPVQNTPAPHRSFAASRLVRLLEAWTLVAPPADGMDLAERTSLWIDPLAAIRLQSVHQSIRAMPATATARRADPPALASELQRVRAVLAQAIAQQVPAAEGPPAFAPYHRRHLELQRAMEVAIAPLRAQARQVLARASLRLRRLAALDEGMEQVLAAREHALLPTVAALLERRFLQLRPAAADGGPAAADADWLPAFEADWRQALLGELDLRLEPVKGLLEALAHEMDTER